MPSMPSELKEIARCIQASKSAIDDPCVAARAAEDRAELRLLLSDRGFTSDEVDALMREYCE